MANRARPRSVHKRPGRTLIAQRFDDALLGRVEKYRRACERQSKMPILRCDALHALVEIGLETVEKAK